jgi:hypothetical protein
MEKQFYRITIGDSAVKLRAKPQNIEFTAEQLAQLNEALPAAEALGLQIISFETVTRESDFDMDDSRKWMASLDATLIISSDETTANLLKPYSVIADELKLVTNLLDEVARSLPGPKLGYSGEWVVAEIAPAPDYEPASAAPKF